MLAVADPKLKDKEQPGAVKPDAATEPVKPEAEPLGEGAMAFINTSLNLTGRKKRDAPAKPEKKSDKEADDELDELHKPPQKPPAPAKPSRAQPAAIDEDRLGEAVGRAVSKAIGERDKPAEPKEPELPAEVKSKLVMYERLAKHFPDKYKDHAKKFLANAQKFTDYSEKWEKDHPGQDFDDTSEEHEAFRSTLEAETEYDEDDHVSALADEIADRKVLKATEEFSKKLDPFIRKEELEKKREAIVSNRDKIGDRFWQRMGEGFAGVLNTNGQLDAKALDELKSSDPIAYDTAVNGAAFVEKMATEVYLLDNGLTDFEPGNASHKFLSDFSVASEQKMAARAPDKQLDDQGRRFMPRSDYNKLPPKEQPRHWTFTYEDLGYLLAAQIAKQTQAHLEAEEQKFSARAKARGLLKEDQSLPAKSHRPARPLEVEEEGDDKPLSPTTPTAPRLASLRGNAATAPTEPVSGFVLRSIRGR